MNRQMKILFFLPRAGKNDYFQFNSKLSYRNFSPGRFIIHSIILFWSTSKCNSFQPCPCLLPASPCLPWSWRRKRKAAGQPCQWQPPFLFKKRIRNKTKRRIGRLFPQIFSLKDIILQMTGPPFTLSSAPRGKIMEMSGLPFLPSSSTSTTLAPHSSSSMPHLLHASLSRPLYHKYRPRWKV